MRNGQSEQADISPCRKHWTELVDAIEDQGLGALIPDDGDSALNHLERRFEDGGEADR